MRANRIIQILIVVFVLVTTAPAFAGQTIYVDDAAAGAGNGSSWADAFNYLQDALTAVHSGDEIRVAQGIYKPDRGAGIKPGDREATFQLISGVALKGGFAGFGEKDPDARDIDLYETILSGDLEDNDLDVNNPADLLTEPTRAENSCHVFYHPEGLNLDDTAIIDGFKITAGNANGLSWPHHPGGGMLNDHSSPTVTNCTFTANSSNNGGGMYNFRSSPTLTNCTFSRNSALIRGCGMHNNDSSPTLTDCKFIQNSGLTLGGGMYNGNASKPRLTNCTFTANSAYEGGGVENYSCSPTLTNCTFNNNSSSNNGGGMFNWLSSNPTLTNCKFSGNSAGEDGGGICNEHSSSPTLTNCMFIGNRAKWGGAIRNYGSPTLTNCIFSGNSAAKDVAGFYTSSRNPTLTNCILWSNSDRGGTDESAQIFRESGSLVVNYSCIQGWTGVLGGTGNIDADPCFTEPSYWDANGTPADANDDVWVDGDYHLLPDSPCIDAGDPNFIAGSNETDLDGMPRVMGGRIDMGAFEYQPHIIYVYDDADGANNGSSWEDAYNYLQDALAVAYYGDEIRVAQGIYKPDQGAGITPGDREATFQLINGVTLKGAYAGFDEPHPNARDYELHETILSGDLAGNDRDVNNPQDLLDEPNRAENSYHVVIGSDTDDTTILDGFIVTGGNANQDPRSPYYLWKRGGGMSCTGSSPTVTNCMFVANTACWGAGMFIGSGRPTVYNCTFRANAADHHAGALGVDETYMYMSIINCTFIGNFAVWNGGAVENYEAAPRYINCVFSGNIAGDDGGAIWNVDSGDYRFINCTFTNNTAGRQAGAIDSDEWPILTNCIFWSNRDNSGMGESAHVHAYYGPPAINYCCVQGWTGDLGGIGNIGEDPFFAEANGADNIPGTEDDNLRLSIDSPCIDTGDPNFIAGPNETDLDGKPRVLDGDNDGIAVVDMGAYEYRFAISAEVRIVPKTINLASRGKSITCYIWLPDDYDVADIEPDSVLLEQQIKPEQFSIDQQKQVAVLRFSREDVQPILDIGYVELTITCQLADGTVFEGKDTIKVTDKAGK